MAAVSPGARVTLGVQALLLGLLYLFLYFAIGYIISFCISRSATSPTCR